MPNGHTIAMLGVPFYHQVVNSMLNCQKTCRENVGTFGSNKILFPSDVQFHACMDIDQLFFLHFGSKKRLSE